MTVRQFDIGSRVCSRFKPHLGPLLRFWKMDPLFPGAVQTKAVTVRQFKMSSRVCSRFKPPFEHLLRFWQTDPSLPGVVQIMAVSVRQLNMNSDLFSRVVYAGWNCLSPYTGIVFVGAFS